MPDSGPGWRNGNYPRSNAKLVGVNRRLLPEMELVSSFWKKPGADSVVVGREIAVVNDLEFGDRICISAQCQSFLSELMTDFTPKKVSAIVICFGANAIH